MSEIDEIRRHSVIELPRFSAVPAPDVSDVIDAAVDLGGVGGDVDHRLLARQIAAKKRANEILGSWNINKSILSMIIPNFFSLSAAAVQGFVVTIFFGKYSHYPEADIKKYGNAVTGAGGPLTKLLGGVAMVAGNGGASLYSRRLGALDGEGASQVIAHTHLATLMADAFNLFIVTPLSYCLMLIGGSSSAETDKKTVVWYGVLMSLFHIISNHALTFNNLGRAQGSVVSIAVMIVFSTAIGIWMDALFIDKFTPAVPSAVAICFSRLVNFAINALGGWLWFHGCKKFAVRTFKRHYAPISWKLVGEITRIGLPIAISQVASALTLIIDNWVGLKLSGPKNMPSWQATLNFAALNLVDATLNLAYMPVFSASQAILPIGSYCFGAGLKRRFRSLYLWTLLWVALMSVVLVVTLITLAPKISAMWTKEFPIIAPILEPMLRYAPFMIPAYGFSLATYPLFICIGKPNLAMFLVALPTLIDTPFGAIGGAIARSPDGITIGNVVGAVTTALINGICVFVYRKDLYLCRGIPEDPAPPKFDVAEATAKIVIVEEMVDVESPAVEAAAAGPAGEAPVTVSDESSVYA